ncbi:MAG: heme exporter protein CcmD [Caulobacterales bacterium]|nr:heme exporter protein CcmD [Caulobacterales bacterium]
MPDLDMSPYGPFVWGAYGISLVMLVALTWVTVSRARAAARRLAQMALPARADEETP